MPIVYTQVYKVPVWVVIDKSIPTDDRELIKSGFKDAQALIVPWPSDSLPLTVNQLANKGWKHIVHQPMPYKVTLDFINMIVNLHLKEVFGPNKSLSGKSLLTVKNLNRTITNGDDYVEICNKLLGIEDPMDISMLFNIAENCFYNKKMYKVFVSDGAVEKEILQKVSDRVITIGATDADIVYNGDVYETIEESIQFIAKLLNITTT